mgnify:CR=1 FL=1
MLASSSPSDSFESLEHALKHYFGYDSFRPGQRTVIEKTLQNQDSLIVLPTGGGKSLCYQLPALLKPGLTIVVSPLIALMQDQVQALQDNGIAATFLNSSLSGAELRDRERAILDGQIKLLYIAPERLLNPEWVASWSEQVYISGVAIDEAHCVSEWGHDFRPEYRQLNQLREWFAHVPITALTATATDRVRQDIIQQLELRDPYVHIATFNRPNLYYEVRPKAKRPYDELLQIVRDTPGTGIVYCLSRKRVEDLANRLKKDDIKALPYHAGMNNKIRAANQTAFIRDDVRVMVATVAFGMGINKPDVRFVVHYDLPRNIEGYYQEAGRAGRDGEPAHCILFFGAGDIKTVEFMIGQKVDPITNEPLDAEQRIATQQLQRVVNYAEATECRRVIQLSYFGEAFPGNCGNCDNCCHPKPVEDWTIEAQKFLSCVARVKERFGMNHIVSILRGSKSQWVLQNRHDRLSTYGIGRDRTADEWRMLGRSLIHQGLVTETTDGYSVLTLNELSWEVLRKQRTVMIAVVPIRTTIAPPRPGEITVTLNRISIDAPQTRPAIAVPPRAATVATPTDQPQPEVELLFERLRTLRKRLADQQGVPPYVIFSNTSLREMAQLQPLNPAQFAAISGVGTRKLEQYGDVFLQEIRQFRQDHGLPLTASPAAPAIAPAPTQPSDSVLLTWQLYQQGLKPSAIANQRNLRLSTITEHLAALIEQGYDIPLDGLVLPTRQTKIKAAIRAVGVDSRRRLRDYLGEVFGYDEINLVVAWWRREQG